MTQKLLIADDEPGILLLLKDYFSMLAYQVIEAKNGIEVLEKLTAAPDIILLDVNMPGLDGFEVCKRIRCRGASAQRGKENHKWGRAYER